MCEAIEIIILRGGPVLPQTKRLFEDLKQSIKQGQE